jgi:hypothetical protein
MYLHPFIDFTSVLSAKIISHKFELSPYRRYKEGLQEV